MNCDARVRILDFVAAAMGEAALNVANMLGRLELRVSQQESSADSASRAADAVLEGYDPRSQVLARLGAYCGATRLRLAWAR